MANGLECVNLSQCQGGLWPSKILFKDISFKWEAPGLHVIMGSSGGGKSTLLKSIGGVWPPHSGQIKIDGLNLWQTNQHTQNPAALSKLGFAFQNNALFSSLRNIENLSFPHSMRYPKLTIKERSELSMHWLEKVGLEQSAFVYPHEISGGMQKRLAIARTLILEPDYIFLDDPTAGLDPITSESIGRMLTTLLEGKDSLVVIVTNDPDRAKDWGPNIHFLHDNHLHSQDSDQYLEAKRQFLD